MTRKLQHTLKALTATAAVFSLMLLAGVPAPVTGPTARFVASAEAANAVDAADEAAVEAEAATARGNAGRHRRGHAATALPYFSFAQGLRQVAGS